MTTVDSKSTWRDSAAPRFPSLERSAPTDVVVIGAGITGITAAYLAKKAGFKVILLERDQFPGGNAAGENQERRVTVILRPK